MALPIKDGTGSSRLAAVDSNNRLAVASITTEVLKHAAHAGDAAVWNSTYAATGGQEVLYIQNTEPGLHLHLSRIAVNNTVTSVFTLFEVTSATAASGTGLTPINPNLTSGIVHKENSFGNASVGGSLTGDTLGIWNNLASAGVDEWFGGAIVLGNTDAVALTTSATGTVYVTVWGFWTHA